MSEPILYTEHAGSCEYSAGLCRAGYYVVAQADRSADASVFGRSPSDFQEATLLFLSPCRADVFASLAGPCPVRRMLAFDPARFRCTALDRAVGEYAFFDYLPREMLHLAACEERIVARCMEDIAREAAFRKDYYSCRLLSQQIRLLLDHCVRMYERQFVTREEDNRRRLAAYGAFVKCWIESGRLQTDGTPSETLCAARAGISPAYLRSLLQFETGCGHARYVEARRIETAKRLLRKADSPVAEIAARLGFPSEGCFSRFFRKITGTPPGEYRRIN